MANFSKCQLQALYHVERWKVTQSNTGKSISFLEPCDKVKYQHISQILASFHNMNFWEERQKKHGIYRGLTIKEARVNMPKLNFNLFSTIGTK